MSRPTQRGAKGAKVTRCERSGLGTCDGMRFSLLNASAMVGIPDGHGGRDDEKGVGDDFETPILEGTHRTIFPHARTVFTVKTSAQADVMTTFVLMKAWVFQREGSVCSRA